ncbi:amino acid/amide ABC transporter ATP-binding protein 1, HAAT family [Frankia sp. EI5c]|uniref:ABC transporter ATP-binding protein n=1 Tax=Frankia sp. EI5c TaxID=683316 RepID=UPI0007C268BD|nr:ABC transporter ATP-binding protein [Frankia sp. EI5c]OAA28119.1 amino acid/amide ABC transporter ATP-binding protein 1, HAAT family [Frankia sp. EI5c]
MSALSGAELIPGPRPPGADDPILDVREVTLRFGGLTSLDAVSLRQERGSVLAVIGPNGAGKTSLFNCLTGAYRPQRGSARFRPGDTGVELVGRSPHRVARLGIARTFQNIRLFPDMSALENVQVGVEMRARAGALRGLVPTRAVRREEREVVDRCHHLLDFVGLRERAGWPAGSLPYGEQRRLEIARALGTRPSLLLLDEPAAGATAAERRDLVALIRAIAAQGVSVLLIEHDIRLVAAVARSIVVLNFGRVIATGPPDQVRSDPAVIEAYLGDTDDARGDTEDERSGS